MRKFLLLLMVSVLILSTLTACYDAHEINDFAYVYTIGLDKGVTDVLRMTVQMPTMKKEGGGGQKRGPSGGSDTQEQDGYVSISIDAPTFYSGANMINSYLPRTLNYMHTKYFVISEELAREGIGAYINGFVRNREIRRTVYMIVTKGKASDFIKQNSPLVGTALSKMQEDIMRESLETGLFHNTTYGEVIDAAKSPARTAITVLAAVNDFKKFEQEEQTDEKEFRTSGDYYAGELVRSGGNKVEYFGTAIFDGDKMVGELNGDESRMMLMARGEFKRGFFAIKDPKKPDTAITLDVRMEKKPSTKVMYENNKPVIHQKITLEGDIMAIQSSVNYESKDLKPVIENEFRNYVKGEMQKTIEKCKGLNADVFKYGLTAQMSFATRQEWLQYEWYRQFKDAEVSTDVEFAIRRTGTMIKTSPILSTEGEE